MSFYKLRELLRQSKVFLVTDNLNQAKNCVDNAISYAQELILKAGVNETDNLKKLSAIIAKCYKLYARIMKTWKKYPESLQWYQKAQKYIQLNCDNPKSLDKIENEIKEVGLKVNTHEKKHILTSRKQNNKRNLQRYDEAKNKFNYEASSRIRTFSSNLISRNSEISAINNSINFHISNQSMKQSKRQTYSTLPEPLFNKHIPESNHNRHTPESKYNKLTPEPESSYSKLAPEANDNTLTPSSNAIEPNPVINITLIIHKDQATSTIYEQPKLSIISNSSIPQLNCYKPTPEKIFIRKKELLFKDKASEVRYYYIPKKKLIEIECVYHNNNKYILIQAFDQDNQCIDVYIKDKIEPFLSIINNQLCLVPVAKVLLVQGISIQKNGDFEVTIEKINPRCYLEVNFKGNSNHNKSKHFIKKIKSIVEYQSIEQLFDKFIVVNNKIIKFDEANSLCLLISKIITINNTEKTIKIKEIESKNNKTLYIYVETYKIIRIKLKYLKKKTKINTDNNDYIKQLVDSIEERDGNLRIHYKKMTKLMPIIIEKKSRSATPQLLSAVSVASIAPTESKSSTFKSVYLIIKIQQKFRKYLQEDIKKLQVPEDTLLLQKQKIIDNTELNISFFSKKTGCLISISMNSNFFQLFVPYFLLPAQRFYYVNKLLNSINLMQNKLLLQYNSQSFEFSQNIYKEFNENRIIYRSCKLISNILYQIIVMIQHNNVLEFLINSSTSSTQILRIDVESLSKHLGIERNNLSLILSFTINKMLVLKDSNICYLDMSKKYNINASVLKLQDFLKRVLNKKKFERDRMRLIYKNQIKFQGNKFCALIFLKTNAVLVRLVRGFDIIGLNFNRTLMEKDGFLLLDIDYLFNNVIFPDIKLCRIKRILTVSKLAKYLLE